MVSVFHEKGFPFMTDNKEMPAEVSERKAAPSGLVNWKFVVVGVLVVAGYYGYGYFRAHPLEGKTAPPFVLPMLDNGTFALDEHLGRRPVILDFWAVWCPPCREGLPKIAEIAKGYHEDEIVLRAVNLGDAPDTVRNFLVSRDITAPVALDTDGVAADLYQVSAIPMLVFIDGSGIVRHVHIGPMSADAVKQRIERIM